MKRQGGAIPIALIPNELITNAIKYAHPDGMKGRITISLVLSGSEGILRVSDDGVGLPEGFSAGASQSLGLQLIQTLAGQIDGRFSLLSDLGTKAALHFPV
ncbi:MAG: sensor histidine kinase [Spirochaetes bacterium]|nr:sensor histidine kinase [Spirochaetota bacterium]